MERQHDRQRDARGKLTVVAGGEGARKRVDDTPPPVGAAAARRGPAGVAQGVRGRRRAAGAGAGDRRRRRRTRRCGSTTPPGPQGDTTCSAGCPGCGSPGSSGAVARGDRNFSQMHYARRGEITEEMRFVALRENVAPGVRARRGGPGPGHHPRQHPPPGAGADDHRPQLPGEDQRQHRQLGHLVVDPGRGRQAAVGDPLGRRHGDGPVHRAPTSTRRASGSCATRRCPSAPCPSTRRWRR